MNRRKSSVRDAGHQNRDEAIRPAISTSNYTWWWGGAGLILVLVLLWSGLKKSESQLSGPELLADLPEIRLEQAAPTVAEIVLAARQRVLDSPGSPVCWGELGAVLFAHQFEFEANACFRQAMKLNVQEFRWPYLLAVSLSVSDATESLQLFRQTCQLVPRMAACRLRLGELLLSIEEFDEAEQHLRVALELDPDDPRGMYDLAQLFHARGRFQDSLPLAEKAARLAPDVKVVHELVAKILHRMGEQEKARQSMVFANNAPQMTLEWRDPITSSVVALRRDATSALERAQTLFDQGQIRDAIDLLRRTIEIDNRSPLACTLLARILIQTGQLKDAESVIRGSIGDHPGTAELRFQLGIICFATRRWGEAEKEFRSAVRLQPNHTLAHYNLGHTLVQLGNEDEALQAFGATIKVRPDYADAYTNLGKIWISRGNRERAEEYLNTAAMLKPDDAEIARLRTGN